MTQRPAFPKRLSRALVRDDGVSLIEIAVGMTVMAIGLIGMLGSMVYGMTSIGTSRQRSAASAVAEERVERIRNLPYDAVALTWDSGAGELEPAHSTDSKHPNFNVTTDVPPRYLVDGNEEELILDQVNGAVRSVEDPVADVAPSIIYVYQYVTWYDDPTIDGTRNYKRVTVVSSWKNPLNPALSSRITMSTLVGQGAVIVPTPTPAASPTPAPTSPPSITCTSGNGAIDGTMSLQSGSGAQQGYTNRTNVDVRLSAVNPVHGVTVKLWSGGDAGYQTVTTLDPSVPDTTVSWAVSSDNGSKKICALFENEDGSDSAEASVILDQTVPSTPGQLGQISCSSTGGTRLVQVSWGASSDAYLAGYRLYVSENGGTYLPQLETTDTSVYHATSSAIDSARYVVRAYDRSGNESADTNVLTYTSNACLL